MKRDDIDPDELLDRTAREIREETIDDSLVEGAAARVWARLSQADTSSTEKDLPRVIPMRTAAAEGARGAETASGHASPRPVSPASQDAIRGCSGFQALIPVYLAGSLPSPRVLLVEDHLHACPACRRVLEDRRQGKRASITSIAPVRARSAMSPARWGLAAAAAIVLTVAGIATWQQLGPGGTPGRAEIQSLEGTVYRVSGSESLPMRASETFEYGQEIRTAKGSRAVIQLADGSHVEMNDRSEMSVSQSGSNTTIDLSRGDIIVQASKRTSGHLFVQSGDALVSVTGTIFSVNRGTKGVRVSVIEGQVQVAHGAKKDVLSAGDQVTTHRSLAAVPVAEEIAWSRDVDRYLALLSEMRSMKRDLEQVRSPALRHSTDLLDSVPEGTVLYAAIPNLSGTLIEANQRIQEHVAKSEVLREWFERNDATSGGNRDLEQMLDKIRLLGNHLGEEIVLSVQAGRGADLSDVVMIAELKNPEEFRPVLEAEVRRANSEAGGDPKLRILPEHLPAAPPAEGSDEILLWIHGNRLVGGSSHGLIRQVGANIDDRGANPFLATSFRDRIAESYREGAGWLFCVNVESLVSRLKESGSEANDADRIHAFRFSGFEDARQFILEVKETADRTNARAVLTFDKAPRGMASWLAEPGPMGALTFVSPDATLLAAFVVKDPVLLLDDLFGMIEASSPEFREQLSRFESENGVSLRDDVAAQLGGEFALALDGPVLPVPSWKAVFEVYDPVQLQQTIERVVAKLDVLSRDAGKGGVSLVAEPSGGRTFYAIRSAHMEIHYVFVDGYLVAAPRRALLDRAIQGHESGYDLSVSTTFRSVLPEDGRSNFSAVLYQNVGPMFGPVAKGLARGQVFTPEQQTAIDSLGADAPATLAYAYSENNRIILATSGKGSIASSLGSLFGLEGGEQGVAQMFKEAIAQGTLQGEHHEGPESSQ